MPVPSRASKRRAAAYIAAVDGRAASEQRLDDALVARLARPMKRRAPEAVNRVELRARRNELAHAPHVAVGCFAHQLCGARRSISRRSARHGEPRRLQEQRAAQHALARARAPRGTAERNKAVQLERVARAEDDGQGVDEQLAET